MSDLTRILGSDLVRRRLLDLTCTPKVEPKFMLVLNAGGSMRNTRLTTESIAGALHEHEAVHMRPGRHLLRLVVAG